MTTGRNNLEFQYASKLPINFQSHPALSCRPLLNPCIRSRKDLRSSSSRAQSVGDVRMCRTCAGNKSETLFDS